MKLKLLYLLLALALPVLAFAAADEWEQSVVRVIASNDQSPSFSTGTAFAVNDAGHYVTNHHVIEFGLVSSGSVMILQPQGSSSPQEHLAQVLWHSIELDLAILKVESWQVEPLVLSGDEYVEQRQDVVAIGFPGASDIFDANNFTLVATNTNGIISALRKGPIVAGGTEVDVYQVDVPINSGNSGGPLLDDCGSVVGIVQSKAGSELSEDGVSINTTENIGWAIQVDVLKKVLREQGVDFSEAGGPCIVGGADKTLPTWLLVLLLLIGAAILFTLYAYWQLRKNLPKNMKIDSQLISEYWRKKRGKIEKGNNIIYRNGKKYIYKRDPLTGEVVLVEVPDEPKPPTPNPNPNPNPTPSDEIVAELQALHPKVSNFKLCDNRSYSLGRYEQNDIVLLFPEVSGRHARLDLKKGKVTLIDLGSTNGSFVGKVKLTSNEPYELKSGTEFGFARINPAYSINLEKKQNNSGNGGGRQQVDSAYILSPIGGNQLAAINLANTGEATIGRSPECNYAIPQEYSNVSRHHCKLRVLDGHRVELMDTSTNGVWVNKNRLEANSWTSLSIGDKVSLTRTGKLIWALGKVG